MPYIGTSPSNSVRRVHTYTATASQTTFTGASSEGVTLSYADTNYIDVFQNGVLLGSDDYTATSGTSVVLSQSASSSDLIVIICYDVFSVADTVSKTNGGSFDSAVTMSNNLTVSGAFTSQGIDDNASATAITIDSNGNFLVGTTNSTLYAQSSDEGMVYRTGNSLDIARASAQPLILNRLTDTGTILDFRQDGTQIGTIGVTATDRFYIGGGDLDGVAIDSNSFFPTNSLGANQDNVMDLGNSSARWDDVRATNGTIQTSDRNEKQDIEELSDAEKRVAVVAKGLMRKFRWKDKVVEKGDNARTHFGIIAQDLEDAFKAEGLDASKYAMFCSNTWTDDDGKEQTRLGVRYSELLAFIISAI